MEAQPLPRTGRLFLPRSANVLRTFGDERLVEQVRRGNEEAFEAVYDRHHRGILSFCRHMLGSADEAEDAVQQTFISAYEAIRADKRDIRLKPWLYAIARNRCLSTLRARREQPAELDDVPTVGLSDEVQGRADLRELLHDLHELPVEQRAALVLSELGDLSHSEVGEIVGCEVAKVKSLVFQARSSLIETRRARDIPCMEIRQQLATATGGVLRRGPLRRHLRECEGCAEFRTAVMRQRKALAALLPVIPSLGLKKSALAALGFGGGSGTGGGLAALASSSIAVKVATGAVVAGVAAGGFLVEQRGHSREAEAAGGQNGNNQAWPAPPAGTGPGTGTIAHRSAAKASHPQAAVKAKPIATRKPARDRRVSGVHRNHAAPTLGPTAGGGHPQSQPEPTPAAPPGSDSENHGNHHGWTQGRGHQHHEQDAGGYHVPPGHSPAPPSDDTGDSQGDHHGGNGGGHDGGGAHHRQLPCPPGAPPPTG